MLYFIRVGFFSRFINPDRHRSHLPFSTDSYIMLDARVPIMLVTLPLLPIRPSDIFIYNSAVMYFCLLVYIFWPKGVTVSISTVDWGVILINLFLTSVTYYYFLVFIPPTAVYEVSTFWNVPPSELFLLPLWAFANEVIFFCGHRTLHLPAFYGSIHKMHHKYLITNAWASFYSHPLDNEFILFCALGFPFWMFHNGLRCSAPVLAGIHIHFKLFEIANCI
jgi:sterol desaturase/sphingolipid hydroxylase (fatty acid hydroxylase superfamily)